MLADLYRDYKWDGRPWLIAGMGPTFSHIHKFDLSSYNVLGINKVVREIKVEWAHIIDYYIVDLMAENIKLNANRLIIPYFPHIGFRPHPQVDANEITLKLQPAVKDKIMCYNLSTIKFRMTPSPIIHAKYFNAEASLNLIAKLGCKRVRAIGIDGGNTRAAEFRDHGPCDPRGFDLQWDLMAKTIVREGIDYQNLDGSPLNPKLEEKLCEYSSAMTAHSK